MKKPNPSVARPFGQASLPSSFLSKAPNEATHAKPSKQSISLSDFLDRKLGKSSNKSVQEKESSFSSIGAGKKELGSGRDEVGGGGFRTHKGIFRQFNRSAKDEDGDRSSEGGGEGREFQSESVTDVQDSRKRKRKNPFGDTEKPSTSKYLLVLGDDPKPKPKRWGRNPVDKGSKPFYNHYENGCGWWDGNREGIDSEEVGSKEVWEGMGCSTLGGLEWH